MRVENNTELQLLELKMETTEQRPNKTREDNQIKRCDVLGKREREREETEPFLRLRRAMKWTPQVCAIMYAEGRSFPRVPKRKMKEKKRTKGVGAEDGKTASSSFLISRFRTTSVKGGSITPTVPCVVREAKKSSRCT